MSWIATSDPLALVALQSTIETPSREEAARGASQLDTQQRSAVLGEPVPVVFARRRNNQGGVLISPPATEARFENDTSNQVTAFYHLVLSEGEIEKIQVRDIFQRNCRRGSFTQTYNRRAGTWDPGNVIVQRGGYDLPQCPQYCGTVGRYPGMSTLSFQVQVPDGSDEWNRQVHAFIRGGLPVTRLFDNVTGPSDNYCDLIRWALLATGKVPAALIDVPALVKASAFLERQGFTCNIWATQSENLTDLIIQWSRYFLLRESNVGGKRGLRSLLPITQQGDLSTDPVVPVYTFDDNLIMPGSLEINYTPLADRLPFCVQVIWRQQPDDDFGILRTSEVRYAGQAEAGPFESHDLSEFCTNETHAVKVGAYILSKRINTLHTIRFTARPQTHSKTLNAGDIIRVRVARRVQNAGLTYFDWLYEIERITKTLAGEVSYECTHFPVDSTGRSLIARDVVAAQPTGLVLPSNRTGPSCDLNSASDTSVPAETGRLGDLTPGVTIGGGGNTPGAPGGGGGANPDDGLDQPAGTVPLTVYPPGAPLRPGTALVMPDEPCGPGVKPVWRWLKCGQPIIGQTSRYYVIGTAEITVPGLRCPLRGQLRCPSSAEFQETDDQVLDDSFNGQIQYWVGAVTRNTSMSGFLPGMFYFNWADEIPFIKTYDNVATLWTYDENGNEVYIPGADAFFDPAKGPPFIRVVKSRYRATQNDPWVETSYEGLE